MIQSQVSVIVLSYNTSEKLRHCLGQIEQDHELIVVDNASTDGSAEMVRNEFAQATLIANSENLGFGPANNIGAAAATRPFLLFLNSDAYAEFGAITLLSQVFADSQVVASGGRLLNPDGSLQASTANRLTLWAVFCEQFYLEKIFVASRVFSPYWTTRRLIDQPEPAECEQVMGACLMVRSGLELFDERFFLYCEDTDLCLRLRSHGKIVFVKSAKFVHELGSSSPDPVLGVARYNRGKELYFLIHHGRAARFACLLMNRAGAGLRAFYWVVRSLTGGGDMSKKRFKGFLRLAFGRDPSL